MISDARVSPGRFPKACRVSIARRAAAMGVLLAVVIGGGSPAAVAQVTSIRQGAGISLSPNPITSTGTVSLRLPLALNDTLAGPMFALTNPGPGDGLDATGHSGLRGNANGAGGRGVFGYGGSGGGYGVYAQGTGNYVGVEAVGGASGGAGMQAIGKGSGAGVKALGGTTGPGIEAEGGTSGGQGGSFVGQVGTGVYAAGGGSSPGVDAQGGPNDGFGIEGFGSGSGDGGLFSGQVGVQGNGTQDGVRGISSGAGYSGIYGQNSSGNYAGYFDGNVQINGNLNVTGTKNFQIDDPLDPAHKLLVHAAVEAPQPTDVYSGNVQTDSRGIAIVRLPAYFDALNRNFRYQLTVIGAFTQAIVWRTVHDNRFAIRTKAPHVLVSWQVTGDRSDPSMRDHPFQTVVAKPASEQGRYLDPTAYGQPIGLALNGR
jgi:hypothetical protein